MSCSIRDTSLRDFSIMTLLVVNRPSPSVTSTTYSWRARWREAKHPSLLRTFGFSSISTYNTWKKCIDLRLFSKCLVWPFWRPSKSNNFIIIYESLASNLEKVCMTNSFKVLIYLSFLLIFKDLFL